MLVALVVGEGVVTPYGARALLVALLLLVANPVASHALVRAAYKTGVPMWPGAVLDQVADREDPPAGEAEREDGSGGVLGH
jgi:multicomponent Na+:H+ antiporter subunit G